MRELPMRFDALSVRARSLVSAGHPENIITIAGQCGLGRLNAITGTHYVDSASAISFDEAVKHSHTTHRSSCVHPPQ